MTSRPKIPRAEDQPTVSRDLIARLVRRSRTEQGLPERLEDPVTIERVLTLLRTPPDAIPHAQVDGTLSDGRGPL